MIVCNAQSLLYKLDELRILVDATKPAFVCVTETWFSPEIETDCVQIRGYQCFRCDRRDDPNDHRRGGGCAIYASVSTRATLVPFPTYLKKPSGFECSFIQFQDPDWKNCCLLCMYVPPGLHSDVFLSIEGYLCDALDFILNSVPDTTLFACGDCNRYNFNFLSVKFNISNIVHVPTFNNVILDKFFCDITLQGDIFAKTSPPLGTAVNAHNIVIIHRSTPAECKSTHLHKVYDLRASHLSFFQKVLSDVDWSCVTNSNDIDICVSHFYDIFYRALSSLPISFVKFTPRTKPWITPVVIHLINKRWKAYREKDFSLYNHYKFKVKEEILKCKRIWSQKMCSTSRGVWTVVSEIRGKNQVNSTDSIVALFSDPVTAAESINQSFCDVFVKSDLYPKLSVQNPVKDVCSTEDVLHFLERLKTDKSGGSDGMLPVFLKMSASAVAAPLSHIFNLSFESGIFPSIWKIADVCPVPKARPISIDRLRPISLLPICSKVFEKIILRKYSDSLLRCYDERQFAYRPESSTVCALLFIQQTVLTFLDDSNVGAVRLITFDMSRAFDRVPHHQLLRYISRMPLPNISSFINWLNSYLSDRKQRVKLGETRSSLAYVTSGVPQGSVLGPILFSLYMSSYKPFDNTKVCIAKYADDVTIILPVLKNCMSDFSSFNNEIANFEDWCYQHQMQINHTKTKVLSINFSSVPLPMCPNYENVCVLKVLGLLFNDPLTWSAHFDFIAKKASQRLYVLRILRPLVSHDHLITIFHCIILSLFDYASPVFLNAGKKLDSLFLSVCKRAYRIIHSSGDFCSKCDFLCTYERRLMLSMKLFKQVLFSKSHILYDLIPPVSLRSKRLILPFVRTSRCANGFFFSCSLEYNRTV